MTSIEKRSNIRKKIRDLLEEAQELYLVGIEMDLGLKIGDKVCHYKNPNKTGILVLESKSWEHVFKEIVVQLYTTNGKLGKRFDSTVCWKKCNNQIKFYTDLDESDELPD